MYNISYELVVAAYRKKVDLRDFEFTICRVIMEHCPDCTVSVHENEYVIEGFKYPKLTRGIARAIGQDLASHREFWPYINNRSTTPRLFKMKKSERV